MGQHLGGLKSAAEAQSELLEDSVTDTDTEEGNGNGQSLSCKQLWKIFIDHLGPHMVRFPVRSGRLIQKSLAYTCKYTLRELPFSPGPEFEIPVSPLFSDRITRALELYTTSRVAALKELYNEHIMFQQNVNKEEVAASMTYFSFSLEEFAREVLDVISVLEDLKRHKESPTRNWWWLLFWTHGTKPHFPSSFFPCVK